jgi:hypothetical protein
LIEVSWIFFKAVLSFVEGPFRTLISTLNDEVFSDLKHSERDVGSAIEGSPVGPGPRANAGRIAGRMLG